MEQHQGLTLPNYPNHVRKLNRAIYGLKQAPRAWFDWFSLLLLHVGFFCSIADSSLFILNCSSGTILLLLYADEIILFSNNPSLLSRLIVKLNSEFAMKDLGHLHYFLGIEISTFRGGLFLSHSKYIGDLLFKAKMLQCKRLSTPLAQKHDLHVKFESLIDASEYRSIVGGLQYITFTRPNLSHAVNV